VPSSLFAQLKAEKQMIIPGTANGFLAAVIALRSLDGGKGLGFHIFSLAEDQEELLLFKNLAGKRRRALSVRSWWSLARLHGVMLLRSGSRDLDATKYWQLTSKFIVLLPRGPGFQKVRSLSELCGLSVEMYVIPKGPVQCKRCQRFGHTQRNCGYAPRCVACGETHLSGKFSTLKQQLKCCNCDDKHTANYRG
jgi:hypothetical protein